MGEITGDKLDRRVRRGMSGIRSGISEKIRSVRTPNTNDEYRGEKKGGDIDTFW